MIDDNKRRRNLLLLDLGHDIQQISAGPAVPCVPEVFKEKSHEAARRVYLLYICILVIPGTNKYCHCHCHWEWDSHRPQPEVFSRHFFLFLLSFLLSAKENLLEQGSRLCPPLSNSPTLFSPACLLGRCHSGFDPPRIRYPRIKYASVFYPPLADLIPRLFLFLFFSSNMTSKRSAPGN